MKGKRVLFLFVSFILVALVSTSSSLRVSGLFASASGPLVTVHFIYVGQGDSIFVDAQGVEVLIDGGPTSAGYTVLTYLRGLGVSNLTLMVATHMDEDHIGGLIAVLNSSIHVNEVLTNNESDTTETYTKFMALAQTHTLIVAQRGQVYTLTSTVNLTVYNPVQPLEFTVQNENSVVLKLQAGETSFLLEGDASSGAEASMINAGLDLHSNVLKVGHHGSKYATTDAFLSAVQPIYAVISCGINNQYGFPDPETLQRLSNHNVTTYGTYTYGTIIATTDGTTITLAPAHDVAVTNIVSSKTVVGQGQSIGVNVTVANLGSYTEVFNVTAYANMTVVGERQVALASEKSTVISFTWNTASYQYGRYNLTGYASPVIGEANTANNRFVFGIVTVAILGDVNGDKTVNVLDLISIALHLGHTNGDGHTPYSSDWYKCMNADLNNDGKHNVLDLIVCATHLGQHWP